MFPDQQNPNGGQPGPQPQPMYQPPQTGVNAAPQQTAGGQYEVVPPPSVTGRPSGHNPYEFIVNPNAPKRPLGLFGGNNFWGKIVLLVGGAVVLIIVLAIIASFFKPQSNTTDLVALAARQQEIIRIATEGSNQAVDQDAKNFTTNAEIAIGSSQSQLVAYLAAHGTKLSDKQLAADQSAATDTLLTNATATNTFDTAVTQNLAEQLKTYEGLLQTTYHKTTNDKTKQLLQQEYTAAALLLEQAKTVQPDS